MKGVELYARVRFAVQIEGVSQREAARRYGIDPRTVAKMLAFSVPPGYRRRRPPADTEFQHGLQELCTKTNGLKSGPFFCAKYTCIMRA